MVDNKVSSVNEELFRPLSHYGPVTALKIFQNRIFAGYGPILRVFDADDDYQMIFSRQVFARNKIHSIDVSKSGEQILVAGARSLAVLDEVELVLKRLGNSQERATGEWLVSGTFLDERTILVLTAHNVVYKISLDTFDILERIGCSERSILYSGSIRKASDGKIYVSAGTVMNGVLIWDLHSKEILHHLTEHEGSIFGVKVDRNAKYIVSCSDDRSIKLYDFTSGSLLSTGWGHGSRIWNLEFCKNTIDDNITIFSTGEDCTARLWGYNSVSKNELLEPLRVVECHLGKHVWSGDVDDEALGLFVTGGADGRVIIHSINSEIPLQKHTLEIISQETGLSFVKNEIVKQFVELKTLNVIVALTSHGQFFVFSSESQKWTSLNIPDAQKFVNFGLLQAFENANIVVAATRNGDLLLINFNTPIPTTTWIVDKHLQGNKIANLLAAKGKDNSLYLLIDCPNPKIPLILHQFQGDLLVGTSFLSQPEQLSFTTTCLLLDEVNGFLIVGSRYVSIAIYDINTPESDNRSLIPIKNFYRKLSPGDTITSLSMINSSPGSVEFLVTVRDGVFMVIGYDGHSLNILHKNKISRGFVEGGYFRNNSLILFGFKSSSFYVWDETNQLELFNELCGGAHRQWSFDHWEHSSESESYKFMFINKSHLYVRNYVPKFTKHIIHSGTHGREIRDIDISPEIVTKSGIKSRLLLTASEDTMVKLSDLNEYGETRIIWSMNAHVSGLQKVKFLNNEYAASSAANEEFIIWRIQSEKVADIAHLTPTATSNPDLRIMDFDLYPVYDDKELIGFNLVLVYLDSNIKVFYFHLDTCSFKLLSQGKYLTCCLLNVNFVTLNSTNLLVIGATDGHLTVWSETLLDRPLIRSQLHQSGIKTVLVQSQMEDSILLVTGGDDNKLQTVSLTQKNKLSLDIVESNKDAASSTITAINKLNDESFVVTSVDQIVRKWSVSPLSCISARYTSVADTGSLATTIIGDKDIVVIGGAGLSVWEARK